MDSVHQPGASPQRDIPHVSQPKRILIVDDNDHLRRLVRHSLESLEGHAYLCDEASNGVDAIAKARQLHPDLIILDLSMPIMNGYDAALVLQRELPQMPVVLFTSYADQIGSKILGQNFSVKAIVAKSDGMGILIDSIQSLLGS